MNGTDLLMIDGTIKILSLAVVSRFVRGYGRYVKRCMSMEHRMSMVLLYNIIRTYSNVVIHIHRR